VCGVCVFVWCVCVFVWCVCDVCGVCGVCVCECVVYVCKLPVSEFFPPWCDSP
jgi:hypothetical protein